MANAWVLKGMVLNLDFLLLVRVPEGCSEMANHFLNFLLLMQPLVKLKNAFCLCSLTLKMFVLTLNNCARRTLNSSNDDEYNDVNEHLVKLDNDKTDQSNEVNDNKPEF